MSHRLLRRPVAAVAVAVLAVTMLAACAGAAEPTPTAPAPSPVTAAPEPTTPPPPPGLDLASIDPCALVTKAEAEELVGGLELEEPQLVTGTDRSSCTYFGLPTGPVRKVDVYVGQGAENILGLNRDTLTHDFDEVEGVGDEAYQKPYEFYFRIDEVWFFIGVVRLVDAEELRESIEEAARRAASRL